MVVWTRRWSWWCESNSEGGAVRKGARSKSDRVMTVIGAF